MGEGHTESISDGMGGNAIIALFTRPSTCIPCRNLKPHWEALSEGPGEFVTYDLDLHPEVIERYGIMSVPTILVLEDGEIVKELKSRTFFGLTQELGNNG